MAGNTPDLESEYEKIVDTGRTGVCRFCQLPDVYYEFIQEKVKTGHRTWRAYQDLLTRHDIALSKAVMYAHFESAHYQQGVRRGG